MPCMSVHACLAVRATFLSHEKSGSSISEELRWCDGEEKSDVILQNQKSFVSGFRPGSWFVCIWPSFLCLGVCLYILLWKIAYTAYTYPGRRVSAAGS